ncbi:hypothetical protein FEM48_Zijuj05G0108300 [Ziziphus jujuba var. spinosa]|uniref:Uncharacterized protein n=1 Tax=Ziziphus jujuba var. spinosa TaxID=714518 RepID=A0A978VEJ0_ZIZJJ|nr:hypothetical protein FEM48_Zijuj05G0108300 [Ziziphus jujuba var. spinosa]
MDPTGSDTKLVAHANGSQPPPGQWTAGLFACYEDPSSCKLHDLVSSLCNLRPEGRDLGQREYELLCSGDQEYRELKNRGIDPSAGWKANAEKMKQSGASAPPHIAPGMRR